MIVLVNLNDYLGGGETLFVRMAAYLKSKKLPFKLICLERSYISNDLNKRGIKDDIITIPNGQEDYYYLSKKQKEILIETIVNKLDYSGQINFISFSMSTLYVLVEVSKRVLNSKVVHLILHYQDNLFLSQNLIDKFVNLFKRNKNYSKKHQIVFNRKIFNLMCENEAVIPMSDLMVKFWNKEQLINLKNENVVALPTHDFNEIRPIIPPNNYKIIWIGRIVNFKIPGLCVMLNFIKKNEKYSITIIGSGDRKTVDKYIEKNKIDKSRINFIGQVDYSKIEEIIKQHSIGYAMGTSIIEICKYGLPSIMALSTPKHQLFKNDICGGLYADCVKGNVGDNLFAGELEENQVFLNDVMKDLEQNYELSAEKCYDFVKRDFSFTTNIEKYLTIIDNAECTDFSNIIIPKAPLIRCIFHKILSYKKHS